MLPDFHESLHERVYNMPVSARTFCLTKGPGGVAAATIVLDNKKYGEVRLEMIELPEVDINSRTI